MSETDYAAYAAALHDQAERDARAAADPFADDAFDAFGNLVLGGAA